MEEGEDEQEQEEEEDLMETLRPRHKRLWNFLSKLPAPGRWRMTVGLPLKKAFSLTVKFACVERLPDAGADAEEEDGGEDNNDDEEGEGERTQVDKDLSSDGHRAKRWRQEQRRILGLTQPGS